MTVNQRQDADKDLRVLIACCVAVVDALLVVGAVSHGVIRHIVQTSPFWIGILLAARRSPLTKWATLPCFTFWLFTMVVIWLFLLGWTHMISGTFSPTEIAMTIVVGVASAVGIIRVIGTRSGAGVWPATITALLIAVMQLAVFRLSFLPQIAHR